MNLKASQTFCMRWQLFVRIPISSCGFGLLKGRISHISIFGNKATYGHEWRTSICIEKPEYFLHDKDIVLNGKQRKKLLEMLSQKLDGPALFKTNWEKLVWQWNEVPDAKKIPYDELMKDYKSIVVPKQDS